jgi:deoxyribodipyrimidine photolyase
MQQLIDGDPAANNGGWQWTAGTGTDAAPYFRIFNPSSQGSKFDPDGVYVRRWLPELAAVPTCAKSTRCPCAKAACAPLRAASLHAKRATLWP